MSDVRLGFIGTGGNMNRHLRELTEIGGTKFVAFCDIVVEKAEQAVTQYGGKAYGDYNHALVTHKGQPRSALIYDKERNSVPEELTEEEVGDIQFFTGSRLTQETEVFEDFIQTPEQCLLFAREVSEGYIHFLSVTFDVIEVEVEGIHRKAIPYGIFK